MVDQRLEKEVNLLHQRICYALADPKRVLILYALSEKPLRVNELAAELDTPQPSVSRHLRVLRERGLVETERDGTSVIYSLSDIRLIEAVDLLRNLDRMQGSEFVFPAARGGMLSDAALSACMKRIHAAKPDRYLDRRSGRPAVPHGLRSTFRDWAAERTEYPSDMAEIALAHSVGSEVERAYRRGDMIEKRRGMMAAWGRFLRGEAGAKIVKMEAGR